MPELQTKRCAGCRRVYADRTRGFYCPRCEREAQANEKAILENRRAPELPEAWRK